MSDPIHEFEGQWYFWDEVWAYRIGPYDTREEAAKSLDGYCTNVLDYEERETK